MTLRMGYQRRSGPRFVLPAAGIDPVVEDFITRAGITDDALIEPTNSLYLGLVEDELVTGPTPLIDAFFPFVGATAQAHAENLLSALYPWTWAGTITHDANGITGNGSTGWGTNTYRQSEHGAANSVGHYAYCRTQAPSGSLGLTRATTGAYYHGIGTCAAFRQALEQSGTTMTFGTAGDARGSIFCVRVSSTNVVGYDDADPSEDAANNSSADLCEGYEAILVRHWGAGGGDLDQFSDANLAAWALTRGMNQTQYNLLRARVNTFQTALGRNVV